MKMLKTLVASVVLASTFAAGSASAITVDQVTSSANVHVTVEDGVATVFGHVESNLDRILVAEAAKNIEGVEKVRNLVSFSQ